MWRKSNLFLFSFLFFLITLGIATSQKLSDVRLLLWLLELQVKLWGVMTARTPVLWAVWTVHLSHRPQVDCVIPAAWRQPDLLASIRAGMTQASAWLWNPHADVAKRGTVGVTALGLDSSSPCFSLLTCFIQIPDSTGLHNAIIVVVSFC